MSSSSDLGDKSTVGFDFSGIAYCFSFSLSLVRRATSPSAFGRYFGVRWCFVSNGTSSWDCVIGMTSLPSVCANAGLVHHVRVLPAEVDDDDLGPVDEVEDVLHQHALLPDIVGA
jgi:hypothetical protein